MIDKSHLAVFLLTFFGYAGLHSLREGWSYTKTQIRDEFSVDKVWFGLIDTLYLVSYSIGMAVTNQVSHRMQLKNFVSFGMVFASFFYVCVALSYQITGTFSQVAMLIFMCFNGFFQSTGWPGIMGIMGNWFEKGKTGVIMGIWAINANVGNIIGSLICNLLEDSFHVKWYFNFWATGIFCALCGLLIFLFLTDSPAVNLQSSRQTQSVDRQQKSLHGSLNTEGKEPSSGGNISSKPGLEEQIVSDSLITERSADIDSLVQNDEPKKKMNIFSALCFPRVPFYVVGYSMLKGCMYGLLFWLPTYLAQKDLNDQKGYISTMIDTGSFIGGLYIGYLGDKYHHRAVFLSPLLFVSAVVMFFSAFLLTDIAWQYYVSMFAIGLTIGGPYNIIGTVITIDIGNQTKAHGGNTATVSALIEGTAAIFAAGSQTLISIVDESDIFYIFFAECIVASLVLVPMFLNDFRSLREDLKRKDSSNLSVQT